MKDRRFVAIIISNRRPDRVYTYDTLRRSGYTGDVIVLIDDEDETAETYRKKYGEEAVTFSKKKYFDQTDRGDNFPKKNTGLFARNAAFDVAISRGYEYFIELDDDYRHFKYRFDDALNYSPKVCKNLDRVFEALVNFVERTKAETICLSQGGDFIGGEGNQSAQLLRLSRKAMNSFVFRSSSETRFVSRLNDDVSTYVLNGNKGKLFFTTYQVSLEQIQTQAQSGGLTEAYLESGTYVKSFYSVMYHPSGVRVKVLRDRLSPRLHHTVAWRNTAPMILRESVRKI